MLLVLSFISFSVRGRSFGNWSSVLALSEVRRLKLSSSKELVLLRGHSFGGLRVVLVGVVMMSVMVLAA